MKKLFFLIGMIPTNVVLHPLSSPCIHLWNWFLLKEKGGGTSLRRMVMLWRTAQHWKFVPVHKPLTHVGIGIWTSKCVFYPDAGYAVSQIECCLSSRSWIRVRGDTCWEAWIPSIP